MFDNRNSHLTASMKKMMETILLAGCYVPWPSGGQTMEPEVAANEIA